MFLHLISIIPTKKHVVQLSKQLQHDHNLVMRVWKYIFIFYIYLINPLNDINKKSEWS